MWKILFQFHYGTIKSWLAAGDVGVQILFQFHYGTIKSYLSCRAKG